MPRRDDLTYDVDTVARRRVPWRSVALLVVVVGMAIVLAGWVIASRLSASSGQGAPAAGSVAGTSETASTSPSPSSASSPSTNPSATAAGSDDGESAGGAPVGSVQTASAFVQAWLARDPKVRRTRLAATAVPALAEQLQLTSEANIPQATAAGAPVVEGASTYSVQFVQALSSGMKIRVFLVADPQARFGWSATSVERA